MKKSLTFEIIILTIFVALTPIAGKIAVKEIDPFSIVILRYFIAIFVLKIILFTKKKKIILDWKDWKIFLILAITGIVMNQIFFIVALKYTVPSHPPLLYSTCPIWILLYNSIKHSIKIDKKVFFSALIAIFGVILVLGKNLITYNKTILFGDGILLFAVACWTLYLILGPNIIKKYGPIETTYILLIIGLIIYSPFGIYRLTQVQFSQISINAWIGLAYMGIFTTALSYVLYYSILRHIEASKVGILISAQPPTTILFSILLGFETLQLNLILGTVFIIGGILYAKTINKGFN